MRKILFVMHSLEFGGAERSLVNLLCEFPAEQYQVDVLLFQPRGAFLKQLPSWVNVITTPQEIRELYAPIRKAGKHVFVKLFGTVCARAARRSRKARAAWRWRRFYRKSIPMLPQHYDTAVAFTGSEILYYVADRVSADKKIVFIHNDYHTAGYSAEDDKEYLGRMDKIVSISVKCVDVLKETFPELKERMRYVENITSSTLIRQRAQEMCPAEYRPGRVNILSVGRLWPQKGFDMAVDAAAILKEKGFEFQWYIVGEGSLRKMLEKQIADRKLTEHFYLLGTRENPYPYMAHSSVLVQSSRYEGKSVVLDEAKMLCKPIVATDYPTVGDQIRNGYEGVVVPMSAEGIAEGVIALMNDKECYDRIVDYLAQHEYGNQQEIEKYLKLLD